MVGIPAEKRPRRLIKRVRQDRQDGFQLGASHSRYRIDQGLHQLIRPDIVGLPQGLECLLTIVRMPGGQHYLDEEGRHSFGRFPRERGSPQEVGEIAERFVPLLLITFGNGQPGRIHQAPFVHNMSVAS